MTISYSWHWLDLTDTEISAGFTDLSATVNSVRIEFSREPVFELILQAFGHSPIGLN